MGEGDRVSSLLLSEPLSCGSRDEVWLGKYDWLMARRVVEDSIDGCDGQQREWRMQLHNNVDVRCRGKITIITQRWNDGVMVASSAGKSMRHDKTTPFAQRPPGAALNVTALASECAGCAISQAP